MRVRRHPPPPGKGACGASVRRAARSWYQGWLVTWYPGPPLPWYAGRSQAWEQDLPGSQVRRLSSAPRLPGSQGSQGRRDRLSCPTGQGRQPASASGAPRTVRAGNTDSATPRHRRTVFPGSPLGAVPGQLVAGMPASVRFRIHAPAVRRSVTGARARGL